VGIALLIAFLLSKKEGRSFLRWAGCERADGILPLLVKLLIHTSTTIIFLKQKRRNILLIN